VNTEQTAAAVGNLWVSESGDVTCSITCWTGNGTADTLLQRADDLYDLIDVALRADRYLGGVSLPVRLTTSTAPVRSGTGVSPRLHGHWHRRAAHVHCALPTLLTA